MTARAFITGLAGLALAGRGARLPPRGPALGPYNFQAKHREVLEQVQELVRTISAIRLAGKRPCWWTRRAAGCNGSAPPHWPVYPAGAALWRRCMTASAAGRPPRGSARRLIAADLAALGIDVDCLPLADVPVAGADPVIGDRAYGTRPGKVAAIAGAIARGCRTAACCRSSSAFPATAAPPPTAIRRLPVVTADRADARGDRFAAFRPLAGLPLGMTAHVVFTAIDPVAPATTSVTMVREVIRGFDRIRGSVDERRRVDEGVVGVDRRAHAARRSRAGCDIVLHCNGELGEMRESRPPCRCLPARRRVAPLRRWRRAARRRNSISRAARATFAPMMAGDRRPSARTVQS